MEAEGFAAVPTWMIRDDSVSGFAVLVYAALASRAGLRSNVPKQETLALEARCSERRVRDALKELEGLGVVERVPRRSAQGYRISDGYRLLSRPILDEEELPAPAAGGGGLPAPGSEPTGTTCRAEVERFEVDSNPSIVSPVAPAGEVLLPTDSQLDNAFSAFWSCYPRKVGRPVASKAFDKAVKRAGGATPILEGARRLRDDPNLPTGSERNFIPHPSTWLNRDGWEDEPLPPRYGASSVVDNGRGADALLAGDGFPDAPELEAGL